MDPKQCFVLQELPRPLVPATPIKGFPSPANAPTLARKRGPLFPPSALLSPETGLSEGDKEHAGPFLGFRFAVQSFSCDLVSPCKAQEPALDPQAVARNA